MTKATANTMASPISRKKVKIEDDPAGSMLVKNLADQKAVMYLGVTSVDIKKDFPIGGRIPHALMIALRTRRARVKANNIGDDVPSGSVFFLCACKRSPETP